MRCLSAHDGGRWQRSRRHSSSNAISSPPSRCSTASALCSSKTRYDKTFMETLCWVYQRDIQCKWLTKQQMLQYWRLLTTFLYFGPLSLDLLFHVFFLQRYSRLLEESSGRSPAHFSWLLLYATSILLCLSPMLSMPFLGSALSSSLVYIWSRRNPETRLSFLGLLVFTAPYLPWVLMGFSLMLHGSVPKDEICGVIVGHGMSFFG